MNLENRQFNYFQRIQIGIEQGQVHKGGKVTNKKNDVLTEGPNTAQKMKFSIKNFFSKCDQIRRELRIWLHLLKKYFMENFIFCAVKYSCQYYSGINPFNDQYPYHIETNQLERIDNQFAGLYMKGTLFAKDLIELKKHYANQNSLVSIYIFTVLCCILNFLKV